MRDGVMRDIGALSEAERRLLMRTDWGFIRQDPADGLRMAGSAGANVGERLMGIGARHYGEIRAEATSWLERVEIDADRIDDLFDAPPPPPPPPPPPAACASVCNLPATSSPIPA